MAAFCRSARGLAALSLVYSAAALTHQFQDEAARQPLASSTSTATSTTTSTPTQASRYYKQTLTNLVDLQYWGDLDIGGQVIQGIMDTGSYELLVCSENCQGCGQASVYKHSNSTEEIGFYGTHFYGSGSTLSQMVTDTVAVTGAPASAGLSQTGQYVWEIMRADMPVIEEGNFQAIVGLGPPEVADDDARASAEFAESLLDEYGDALENSESTQEVVDYAKEKADYLDEHGTLVESWDVRAFSVCLLRPYEQPGYLIWNDESTREAQPDLFSYVKVTGDRTWGVSLTDVTVGETALGCGNGCGAILDSGTSLIMTDPDTWEMLTQFLIDEQTSGNLEPDCSNIDELPDLVFKMGDVDFRLPPQSYVGTMTGYIPPGLESFFPNAESGEVQICDLLISPIYSSTSDGPLWIMAMPFFREYYSTFDLGDDPRDPKSRSIYTAPVDDDCAPMTAEASSTSTMVQSQRKTVRYVDRSKVRIPSWALDANETGQFRM